ncbi:hypothetical protein Srufu_080040 (plasmid) [Streptomyces libani subsp. rufus]|nr:hypothetical protein Srufu_080040 [Streptomyces libani subsp. rufus]
MPHPSPGRTVSSTPDDHLGDLLAGTTTPGSHRRNLARTVTHWQGRALLTWARILQRTVAGDQLRQQHVARRNRAIRAAHARGVTKTALARATGLSEATIGQALKGEATSD